MVGNTILAALDGRFGGYAETFERIRALNRDWEIYGHDIYEDALTLSRFASPNRRSQSHQFLEFSRTVSRLGITVEPPTFTIP